MPPKPKPAFPNPAVTLPGEADVLANVLADLSDHAAKLVYADWLEEHNDKRGPLLRNFITAYREGKKLPSTKAASASWRDLVGISVIERTHGTPLAPKTDQLLALARPAIIHNLRTGSDKSLAVGASKLGGRPDLPEGTEWPEYDDVPLAFLGQFNLADFRPTPVARELPDSGLLSFFCLHDEDLSPDDFTKGTWRVLHFPDTAELVRHEWHDELDYEAMLLCCRLEFSEGISLPGLHSPWKKELQKIIPNKDDKDHEYENAHDGLLRGDHLLGYPHPLRDDVLGKKTVRHLLTLGDYDEWGWTDGDVLYFTIAEADLKQHRFDRVRFHLEVY